MKVNWKNFHVYGDIARKQEIPVPNPQEQVANAILGHVQGIAGYALADKVYKDNGDAVYEGRDAELINRLMDTLPAPLAIALKEAIAV